MKKSTLSIALVLTITIPFLNAQTIKYIKPVAEGAADGTSWDNASSDLSSIISQSNEIDEIWIAAGTYRLQTTSDISTGIKLYGGFSGIESSLDERDPKAYVTIISGDIGEQDYKYDNNDQLFRIFQTSDTVLIDGITIKEAHGVSTLSFLTPFEIAGNYDFSKAVFGPQKFQMEGDIEMADPIDGCNTISTDLTGKIALIQRGTCTLSDKAMAAQMAGAIGVLIFNDVEGVMPPIGGEGPEVNIPVAGISKELGDTIIYYIKQGQSVSLNAVSANGIGTSLYVSNGILSLNDCNFINNEGEYGNSIYSYFSEITITNCVFSNNISKISGAIYSHNSNLYIANSLFGENIASYGSTIYSNFDSDITLSNCTFSSNYARVSGTVYNDTSVLNVDRCEFTSNYANYGGAIHNRDASSAEIKNTILADNEGISGGAVYSYSGKLNIDSCQITNNTAEYGGGFRLSSNTSMISNSFIAENRGIGGGGGLIIDGQTEIDKCFIYKNTSINADSTWGTGGGLQLQASTDTSNIVKVSNTVFSDNSAGGNADDGGGAVMIYGGDLQVTNTTFVNNSTKTLGGAIRITENLGSAELINTILWNNTASEPENSGIVNTGNSLAVNYSIVQEYDTVTGVGNLSEDPLFVNISQPLGDDNLPMTKDDGLRITENSPAIDAGDPAINDNPFDIIDTARSGIYDIGAYEFTQTINNLGSLDDYNNITIYPVPANQYIIVSNIENSKITIYDMNGKAYDYIENADKNVEIDIADLMPGIYILKIQHKHTIEVARIIKE